MTGKHEFVTVQRGHKFRWHCECGKFGSWVQSDDRAADGGDRHAPNARRAWPSGIRTYGGKP